MSNFKKKYTENKLVLEIPELIDIDNLLKNNPPQNNPSVDYDSILYLINLIYKRMHINPRNFKNKEDGFIPLKSEYVRKFIYNWEIVRDYLIENKIIQCDDIYNVGLSSLGYRINPKFINGSINRTYFRTNSLYSKIERICKDGIDFQKYMRKKRFYILTPYENKSITIDIKNAYDWINSYFFSETNRITSEANVNEKQKELDALMTMSNLQIDKINRINNFELSGNLIFDRSGERFHTIITSLKKELRNYLRIDGEELVQIDLKNSQPYLLLLFFNKAFWSKRKLIDNQIVRLKEIDIEFYTWLTKNKKIVVPQDNSTLKFIQLVKEGNLYDYCLNNYKKIYKEDDIDVWEIERNIIKRQILSFLYDANRRYKLSGIRKYLQNEFHEIVAYIRELKSFKSGKNRRLEKPSHKHEKWSKLKQIDIVRNYDIVDSGFTKLCTTLQKIESNIFLDRICGKLYNEYPGLNYITIHDSIIVPKSKEEIVYNIMMEEIEIATGRKPVLQLDKLNNI